jgi:hypothetical protein
MARRRRDRRDLVGVRHQPRRHHERPAGDRRSRARWSGRSWAGCSAPPSATTGAGARLIGAAAGGLIGAGIGSSIADRKAQYARRGRFPGRGNPAQSGVHRGGRCRERQLYQEIARLDRESQRLAREYRAGKATRDALAGQKATLEKQLAKAKQINSLAEKTTGRRRAGPSGIPAKARPARSVHPAARIQRGGS